MASTNEIVPISHAYAKEALPKQRRFVIFTSLIVIAYYLLGLRVDQLQISGTPLQIDNKPGVIVGLWIVWCWSVLRYWQRFYELLADVRHDILHRMIAEDIKLAVRRGENLVKDRFKRQNKNSENKIYQKTYVGIHQYPLIKDPRKRTDFVPIDNGGRRYTFFVAYSCTQVNAGSTSVLSDSMTIEDEWSPSFSKIHQIKSWAHTAWNLPAISEHIGPWILIMISVLAPLLDQHNAVPQINCLTDYWHPACIP